MNVKSITYLFLLVFLLSGCNLDHSFPYYLNGNLNNDTYQAYTMKGRHYSRDSYTVVVPQSYNKFAEAYLQANEINGKNYTYLKLGPMSTDTTLYRLLIVRKCNLSMSEFKYRYFPLIVSFDARGDDRQMVKVAERNTSVNGHPALYEVYTQYKPGLYYYYSRHQPADITFTHAVYFVDYGKYAVIIWIQYNNESAFNGIDRENRAWIINETYKPQNWFLRSFTIHQKSDGCCVPGSHCSKLL